MRVLEPDLPPPEKLLPYLRRMEAARVYVNFGPLVCELEAKLAEEFRASVSTVSNGTAGLELTLHAMGLSSRARSRVLVPALTFSASRLAIERAGCTPVIADAGLELTPEIARGYDVDAVMPVCAYGRPQVGWSDYPLPVLIDAAGAFGNQPYEGRPLVFSMHATKAFGCGEGGFVVGSPELTAEVRRLANFGLTNAKLSEFHAAVALAQLERWPEIVSKRRRLKAYYEQHLSSLAPDIPTIFPVKVHNPDWCASELKSDGIESRRWYVPLVGPGPKSQDIADRILCIPFHNFLTIEDAARVVHILNDRMPALMAYAGMRAFTG